MLSTLDDRSAAPLAPAVSPPFAPPAPVPSSAHVLPTVHGRLAIVLLPLRLFLAAGWLRAQGWSDADVERLRRRLIEPASR